MRTKKTETWLLNMANHMIGQAKLSHHVLTSFNTPSKFFHLVISEAGHTIWDRILPGTMGEIGYFALGSLERNVSATRQIAFQDVWDGKITAERNCGPHLIHMVATIVIAGTMYELLATERIVRFGRNVAGIDYEPTAVMIDFVKKTRIWNK